jgi:thiamine biosynthesis lipoprotein
MMLIATLLGALIASAPIARSHVAMGTTFDILAYDDRALRAEHAITAAFAEIDRLDAILSHFKPSSELRRLEVAAQAGPVRVSSDLYQVLGESLRYARLSGGAFDPTVAPLVRAWTSGERPGERALLRMRACVGWQKLVLESPDHVRALSECLELDLGGIAKGYAVDRAAAILKRAGITRALINAGSSTLLALDPPPDRPGWDVELPRGAGFLTLARATVSVSEQANGHIIDPSTGRPNPASRAVVVIAPTATMSDALSTTLLILGPDRGASVLASLPAATVRWIDHSREGN